MLLAGTTYLRIDESNMSCPGSILRTRLTQTFKKTVNRSDIPVETIPFTCAELATKGASTNQQRSVLSLLALAESELSESNDGSVSRFLYPINTAVTLDNSRSSTFLCARRLSILSFPPSHLSFLPFSPYFYRNLFDCARL